MYKDGEKKSKKNNGKGTASDGGKKDKLNNRKGAASNATGGKTGENSTNNTFKRIEAFDKGLENPGTTTAYQNPDTAEQAINHSTRSIVENDGTGAAGVWLENPYAPDNMQPL